MVKAAVENSGDKKYLRPSNGSCLRLGQIGMRQLRRVRASGRPIIAVPAGNYAEFVHEGPVSELFGTCDQIYRSWFPASGLLMGDGPMVEVYPENFRGNEPNPRIRLLVSVKDRP